jgi:hypothetical protein
MKLREIVFAYQRKGKPDRPAVVLVTFKNCKNMVPTECLRPKRVKRS